MDGVAKTVVAAIARIRKDKEIKSLEDGELDRDQDGFTRLQPGYAGMRGRRGGRGREFTALRNERDWEFEDDGRAKRGGRGRP